MYSMFKASIDHMQGGTIVRQRKSMEDCVKFDRYIPKMPELIVTKICMGN